jgi:Concanavalin A-like lectin/glucanases superfamily
MIIPRVAQWKTTAKGLVASWPMFEGVGPVAHDVSGYGYDLATINSPPWGDRAWPAGAGSALSLDGATQYLQLGSAGLLNFGRGQPFSVLVNTTFAGTGNSESLIGCLDPSNSYIGWELFKTDSVSGNWLQSFMINTFPSNCVQINWNLIPAVNTIYQIVQIYTGNSLASGFSLYANGAAVGQQGVLENSLTASPVSTVPVIVGRRNNGTGYHAGLIGETRLYNRALAPSEVWDIYTGNG